MKDKVHTFESHITMVMAAWRMDMLSLVWGEVKFRLDVCRAVSGAHPKLH
jgi:hypothetical protein